MMYTISIALYTFEDLLSMTTFCPGLAPMRLSAVTFSSFWNTQLSQFPQLLPQAVRSLDRDFCERIMKSSCYNRVLSHFYAFLNSTDIVTSPIAPTSSYPATYTLTGTI